MEACSLCGATLEGAVSACPRCGIATPARSAARSRRAIRIQLAIAGGLLAAGAALALPAFRARPAVADGCTPHGWIEWHVAMEKACLTPAYVCENLTSAKLLQDPSVERAFREALQKGHAGALAHLDAMVGGVRETYGCAPARAAHPGAGAPGAAPRLPPGHPSIGGGAPRLPPGHPPIDGRAAPAAPVFEAPIAVTI